MPHEKLLLYEEAYAVTINEPTHPLYYFFDYDERSYAINMEFQHFHSFYEIHILLDQKAAHIIEGDYYAIQPYDMVFLRPALLHKTEYSPGKPKKRLIINFAMPKNIPGLSRDLDRMFTLFDEPVPIYRFSEEHRERIFDLLNEIFRLGKTPSDINHLAIHTKFVEFLCAVFQARMYNCYQPQELSNSITHKIYSITSYIHTNYAEELSLHDISKQFFISMHHLSHQFKHVTGFTLVNYIQMTRIRNAQQLLLYTKMKVTEIADKCGFTSFSQFNRVFNKYCGVCPSKFRQLDQTHLSILSNLDSRLKSPLSSEEAAPLQ
jgi:AraC-like DNA-binding protein